MFSFDRTYQFGVPPARLWQLLTRTEAYREWWPWLRRVDGDGLVAGGVNTVSIWAPVPWMIHLTLTVTGVVDGSSVDVDVSGDMTGPARLDIGGDARTSTAQLAWQLTPTSPALRVAGRVARPVLQSGQDWVVTMGVGQFRRRGLGG